MEEVIKNLNLSHIELNSLPLRNTALIVVDMVVGFVEEGILSSPRVKEMSTNLLELNNRTKGYNKVYFVDSHNENAEELKAYPAHCIVNTREEELIDGLKEAVSKEDNIKVIKKNSTNGFHAPEFKSWLDEVINKIDNFIIVGCVTDICVLQFSLTLKTYFNQMNLNKKVIVPANCVETFDIPGHPGDEMNLFALMNMKSNGIEVVSELI